MYSLTNLECLLRLYEWSLIRIKCELDDKFYTWVKRVQFTYSLVSFRDTRVVSLDVSFSLSLQFRSHSNDLNILCFVPTVFLVNTKPLSLEVLQTHGDASIDKIFEIILGTVVVKLHLCRVNVRTVVNDESRDL